jgi:energy-coupling factor transporter ATP-binding protein EcfA2
MKLTIKRATKTQSRGRIALVGPAGSGKTYTALKFARALAGESGRILCVDTERGSASKYSGEDGIGDFDVIELESHEPATYVEALKLGAAEGYDVIAVDSLSHAWSGRGGALEQVDRAAARSKGNSYAAWRDVTPMHNALVDALLTSPAHVIVTMRAKTEYILETDSRGKQVPRKVGMAPVQRDGMEYEFDLCVDLDWDHVATVSKSRCSSVSDAVWRRPGADELAPFAAWLTDGAAPTPKAHAVSVDGLVSALATASGEVFEDLRAEAKSLFRGLSAADKERVSDAVKAAMARLTQPTESAGEGSCGDEGVEHE